MSSFLRSLIAGGHVPFLCDYRTGSVQSLSGLVAGTAPTVTNTPTFQRTAKGMAADFRTGRLTYAAAADQVLTQATWFVVLPTLPVPASGVFERVLSKRDVTNNVWEVILGVSAGKLQVTLGVGAVTTNAATMSVADHRTIAWTLVNGQIPSPYAGGVSLGSGVTAVTIAATNPALVVGALYTGITQTLRPVHLAGVINVALSPADIARLHRELVAAPGIVARARKSFSIPYPVKTPAEYAAEGVIYATDGRVVSGKLVDMTGGGRQFTPNGQFETSPARGPFDTQTELFAAATLPADATLFRTNTWSVHAWIKPRQTQVNSGILMGLNILPHYAGIGPGGRYFVSTVDAGGVPRQPLTGTGFTVNGRTDHVVWVRELSGTDLVIRTVLNGVEVLNVTYPGVGVQIPAATQVNIGRYQSTVSVNQLLGAVADVKYLANVATTVADARKEYLEGARKCLLDARVHSDGSCPVSLAAVGAGNELGNGWKVQSGTWKVVEDAPSGGRAGKRWLKAQAAATVSIRCNPQAYGAWWGKIRFNGVEQEWLFVASNETSVSAATQNGYGLHVTAGGALTLRERAAGVASAILTPGVVLVAGSEYEFWPTRRVDGLFDLNIKGGAYADWTSLGTVTDTTTTQGGYQVLYGAGANAESRGACAYLGEMTPTEAIARGLIDP